MITSSARSVDHAPVFILAPARSFSTVSLAMLGRHPSLFAFPELVLFGTTDVGAMLNEHLRRPDLPEDWLRNRHSGVLRAIAELHEGSQANDAIERAEHWLAEHSDWPTVRLMDHLLELIRPFTGLEKSPDSVSSDEALDQCVTAYPKARFIHLTRHPVTTQRSMHEHVRTLPGDEQSKIARTALRWHLTHLRIAKRLASMPSDMWLRVRAEDLLRDSDVSLRRICDWLRLPYDSDIIARMQHPEGWRFSGTGPDGNLLGGDHKFLRDPVLRQIPEPGPVVFDPAWRLHPELIDQMTQLAKYLGY